MKSIALLVLLAVASATASDAGGVNRPVNKVIFLLREMQAQLEAEQKEDEEIFDKMGCWCETNDKEKTKAIEEAEARITELTSTIEELTATSARLTQEIDSLGKEVEANIQALDQAASIRAKEKAAFNGEEKDMMQSIASLKAAITVLSRHHAPPAETLLHISAMLRHQMSKHKQLLMPVLTSKVQRILTAFMQVEDQGDFFGKTPSFKSGYAPQSGEIFGILNNMKESFESNLSQAQKEENEAAEAFEALKAAKEAQIKAGQQAIERKKEERAKADEDCAQAKQDIEDTRSSLGADQTFLMDLKAKCSQTDTEFADRQKTRQEEMSAVSEALKVLSSDSAHDLFTKTFNSFAQKSVAPHSTARAQVYKLLKAAAAHSEDPQLLQLAATASLDTFTRVKEAIDKMVTQLQKQQGDEAKHRDWCKDELNTNAAQSTSRSRDKSDLQALIEDLNMKIDASAKEIATLEAEIKDAQIQIKRAGEDREAENKEFQATVTDQRETQKVLARALQVLQAFYSKPAELLQQGPPPPGGFKAYKKKYASGGVMAMLQKIMSEAAGMEKETLQAEQDSQAAYETFVKDTNSVISEKQRQITDEVASKAANEGDRTQANTDLAAAMTELEELANYAGEVHSSCDYILNNFEARQTARAQEIAALTQAKAILSGAM